MPNQLKYLSNIDAKLITAGGGIILAAFVVYIFGNIVYKNMTSEHEGIRASVQQALRDQLEVQRETNAVLRLHVQVIEGNTRALQFLENNISRNSGGLGLSGLPRP